MRAFLAAISLLLCCGCQQRQAKMSEEDIKRIVAGLPGITDACIDKLRYGGIQAMPNETDQCFEMMPQRRWTGLWRNAFEESIFCADEPERVAAECPTGPGGTWLEPEGGTMPDQALYRLEFIGRRTAQPAHFGHMGMNDHEIVVDRMISKRLVSK